MFGRKENNMDKDQYFVIRVWYFEYKDTDKYQYSIVSDRAYSMSKAVDIKMAQDIMETTDSGKPIVDRHPNSHISILYKEIAKKIIDIIDV